MRQLRLPFGIVRVLQRLRVQKVVTTLIHKPKFGVEIPERALIGLRRGKIQEQYVLARIQTQQRDLNGCSDIESPARRRIGQATPPGIDPFLVGCGRRRIAFDQRQRRVRIDLDHLHRQAHRRQHRKARPEDLVARDDALDRQIQTSAIE
ncbi:MAG: hypothetical protein U1E83_01715 [Methylotetracoccus sp.]